MFGLKSKTATKLAALEERFVALATKVEENNHDIGELKGEIEELITAKPGLTEILIERVKGLEERQSQLRDRVGELFIVPKELRDD